MGLYNTEAIIIRVRDFDEADKVTVLLTREEGKVQAVAKGARRPRNRFSAATQLFTHIKASLFHGRSLDTFSQIEIAESFRPLREDLVRMAYASYCCELMDEIVKEKQRGDQTFLLLLTTMHLLCAPETEPEPVSRAFELKLLSMLGFRPNLADCTRCGQELGPGPTVRFAPALGGTLCPACSAEGQAVEKLSRGTVETLKRLMDGDIRRAHMIRIAGEMAAEVDRAVSAYIEAHLDRKLKSKDFLDTLRPV